MPSRSNWLQRTVLVGFGGRRYATARAGVAEPGIICESSAAVVGSSAAVMTLFVG